MFVVAGVGAVVGVVAAHGDYSDYGDYSEYSDVDKLMEIKRQEERIESEHNALQALRKRLQARLKDDVKAVSDEEITAALKAIGLSNASKTANAILSGKEQIASKLKAQMMVALQKEIADDQQRIDEINKAIMQINSYKLGQ